MTQVWPLLGEAPWPSRVSSYWSPLEVVVIAMSKVLPILRRVGSRSRAVRDLPPALQNAPVSPLMSSPSAPPASGLSILVRRLSDVSLVRFGLVGASNTAIGFGAFWTAHRV